MKMSHPFSESRWIGVQDVVENAHFAFRRCLSLDHKPEAAPVRITADARYLLWVNGTFVGRGPARGYPFAQPYDEFDLAPFLRPGVNWLAAQVYQFGPGVGAFGMCRQGNGVYVSTGKTGLLMEGEVRLASAPSVPINKEPTPCTRHANALAVWLRVGSPEQQEAAAKLVVAAFAPDHACNNGMSFLWNDKIFGSLFEAGQADGAIRLLQENQGAWAMTGQLHWTETWGVGNVAQLCGSSVNWLLSGYVLGIRPTAPGFAEAVFDPRPGSLSWAKGVVPTPHGNIRVQWKRGADGVIEAVIAAPEGVTVRAASAMVRVTQQSPGEALASDIRDHVEATMPTAREGASVHEFRSLVTTGEWTEIWPDAEGKPQTREVVGEFWNAAIQAALDEAGGVRLPKQDKPYYLDRPIILRSGQCLIADPEAEIRLKPGTNTCMLRNERAVGFQDRPVPAALLPDRDLFVQGGIWTTLATLPRESNGNHRGCADSADSVPGCHGVILLQNVERVVVRDLTIRASRAFGVHLGTARDFLVENLTFEAHRRDGVHCDGPASCGIIRGIRGWTGDDPVSLLAWDWQQYSARTTPRGGTGRGILIR